MSQIDPQSLFLRCGFDGDADGASTHAVPRQLSVWQRARQENPTDIPPV